MENYTNAPQEDATPAAYVAFPGLAGSPPQAPEPPAWPAQETVLPPVLPPVKKPRRVGAFTLGLTLIMLGLLIPYALFAGPKAWQLLYLAPLILVALGIETLIFACRHKSDGLRYDGLSVFLVIAITLCTLAGAAIVPTAVRVAEYEKQSQSARRELAVSAREALGNLGYTGRADVYISRDYGWLILGEDMGWEEMSLDVELYSIGQEEPSREQAVRAFYQVAAALGEQGEDFSLDISMNSTTDRGEAYYELYLYPGELSALTEALVEKRMIAEVELFDEELPEDTDEELPEDTDEELPEDTDEELPEDTDEELPEEESAG